MRMSTKGGATPRDRRLDRGKVAIAALAALFLFATNAKANIVEFQVVQELSSLKTTTKLVGPALGGSKTGVPQFPGSDTTSYYGRMFVDIQDTTIQLLPGADDQRRGRCGRLGQPIAPRCSWSRWRAGALRSVRSGVHGSEHCNPGPQPE